MCRLIRATHKKHIAPTVAIQLLTVPLRYAELEAMHFYQKIDKNSIPLIYRKYEIGSQIHFTTYRQIMQVFLYEFTIKFFFLSGAALFMQRRLIIQNLKKIL